MNAWRRTLAVAAISGGSIFAFSVGGTFLRTAQYAQAAQDVEAGRQALAGAHELANVYKTVGKVVEPSVVKIEVHRTTRAAGSREEDLLKQFFPDRDGDGEPDVPEEFRGFRQSPEREYEMQGTGSGVIMETDGDTGYIVTNNHVAGGAAEMTVTLSDGREFKDAKLVGADPKSDLAVVKITGEGLIPAKWGNSDYLEKGDIICAFGSPFGYVGSMTHGIVSALNRDRVGIIGSRYAYENFIQVDAPINPGNSGGPLVNLRGEVVGINTAIASSSGGSEGIGFTIPINMMMLIAGQLVDSGTVQRAYLGVRLDAAFGPEAAARMGLSSPQGARVTGITKSSPAEAARLQVGDVILAFDGTRIENDNHLINLVSLTPVDKEVEVRLVRSGKPVAVKVRVGNRSDMPAE